MKTTKTSGGLGRVMLTVAFSLSPDEVDRIETRVQELGVACSNRSQYLRFLLDLDQPAGPSPHNPLRQKPVNGVATANKTTAKSKRA